MAEIRLDEYGDPISEECYQNNHAHCPNSSCACECHDSSDDFSWGTH